MFDVRLEGEPRAICGIEYTAYDGKTVIGGVTGFVHKSGVYEILTSYIVPSYHGGKAVRAFTKHMDNINELHHVIKTKIPNDDNREIKLVLNAGFRIVGTATHKGKTFIELIKNKET